MPIEISWIDNASKETPPTIAQRRRERERGERGIPRTETRGDGEHTHL